MFKTISRGIKKKGINVIHNLPPSKFRDFVLITFFFVVHFPRMTKNIKITYKAVKDFKYNESSLYYNSRNALYNYSLRETNTKKYAEYLRTYKKQNVKPVQQNIESDLSKYEPIFICAVKNDLHRVKMQVNHHKNLGISNFVYIDNMSDDGTFEWLIEEGLDVYRVDDKFSATSKNAWFRQITDMYGYNRWYLILDSDELFVYPGMEKSTINNLIDFAKKEQIDIFQSFMIDMYSKDNINDKTNDDINLNDYDITQENCYFDTDTYYIEQDYKGDKILGGPRQRVFSEDNKKFTPLLTKNALMFLKKDDVFSIHHSIPYYKNFNNPIISGLLHYKFLPTDNHKFIKIAEQGNYAGGSAEYKQYLKVLSGNEKATFYYDKSKRFNSSLDLLRINIFDNNYSERLITYQNTNLE